MILGCHQPNFVPHFPFFEKIAISDKFVILTHCQYSKNGYQNRCNIGHDWITNPVVKGKEHIRDKMYTNGQSLLETNMAWIIAICKTLGIDENKIVMDRETNKTGTDRIVQICKDNGADTYLTNPDAFDKYLEIDKFLDAKVGIMAFKSSYRKSIFEMLMENGVLGCREILEISVSKHRNKELAKA